jgi:hypothetical protein
MNPEDPRLLILSKLADGRLPLNSIPRVWGGPGNGEVDRSASLGGAGVAH